MSKENQDEENMYTYYYVFYINHLYVM